MWRDRNGVSFSAYDRICDALELTPDEYLLVRHSLIDKHLIAFDGSRPAADRRSQPMGVSEFTLLETRIP